MTTWTESREFDGGIHATRPGLNAEVYPYPDATGQWCWRVRRDPYAPVRRVRPRLAAAFRPKQQYRFALSDDESRWSGILRSVPEQWFSASVRLVVLLEGTGALHYVDSVLVFRARDWEHAQARALDLGHDLESSYENGDGLRVRWCLSELLTLDYLGSRTPDGSEVHSNVIAIEDGTTIPFDAQFTPERSRPDQTGVPFKD